MHLAGLNSSQLLLILLFLIQLIICAFFPLSVSAVLSFLPSALAPSEMLLEALAKHLSAATQIMLGQQHRIPCQNISTVLTRSLSMNPCFVRASQGQHLFL